MTRSLSVATALEKNRLDSGTPFIVLLAIDVVDPSTGAAVETMRIANNPEPLTFNGDVYDAGKFDLTLKHEAGSQPEVSVTATDYTQAIEARMEAFGGGLGFGVSIMLVNADRLGDLPEIIEFYEVVGANAAEYRVNFKLGAANGLAQTFPRRRQTKDFCQWRFRDPETCRYAGADATCDLTLQGRNGCGVKGNTINFGGCPGISSSGVRYG